MAIIPDRDEKGRPIQVVDHINDHVRYCDAVDEIITVGQTENIDLCLEDEGEGITMFCMKGGSLFGENISMGDWARFSIVDLDGVGVQLGWYDQATFDAMGYFIVKTWVRKRFFKPDCKCQMTSESFSDPIPAGLYLRCEYHSTGTENNPHIYINYDIFYKDEWVV